MFNKLWLLDSVSTLGDFIHKSLISEGYEVQRMRSLAVAQEHLAQDVPHLVLLNGIGPANTLLAQAEEMTWPAPVIALVDQGQVGGFNLDTARHWQYLMAPFAIQDLLVLIQNELYQRTLNGRRPFQFSAALVDRVTEILKTLRQDLRARCIILSSSSGRLIKTVGVVDQGVAISLAALMSASFTASANAAQLLGHSDMFDSNLQESEGYGLYAILLHNKLVLSVAFSARITIGMVRHYAAQAAVDILEAMVQEAPPDDEFAGIGLEVDFQQTVTQALGDIFGD
jgi:predicted regulator of Ras-like GTPase activity (Roadblock/LC7/MglB family)